jgi:hypothetical protein
VDKRIPKTIPMKKAIFYIVVILIAVVMAGEPGLFERATGIDPDPFFDNALLWMIALLLALPFFNKKLYKSSAREPLVTWEKISLIGSVLLFLLICFNPLIVQRFNTNILGSLKPFLFGILILWLFIEPFMRQKTSEHTDTPRIQ